MSAGTFIRLYDSMGVSDVQAVDEGRIDAAVQLLLDTMGGRDTLLDLTLVNGATYRILASDVRSWIVSTPESRQRQLALEQACTEEDREHRIALGLTWED